MAAPSRAGLALLLSLLAGCPRPAAVPPTSPPPPPRPVSRPAAAPLAATINDAATTAVVRAHLLHLLPCQGPESPDTPIAVRVDATLRSDGAPRALRVEPASAAVPPARLRCVLSRIAAWAFPQAAGPSDISFTVRFPLQPPSINDHAAVAQPGGGLIDLPTATAELRRLRERVLACYPDLSPSGGPHLLLVALRVGEHGKLLSTAVDFDSDDRLNPAQPCIHKALRHGQFPHPRGGEVELHFPYVLTR